MLREAARQYDSSHAVQIMTAADFMSYSDGTDERFELVSGVLHAQAGVGRRHWRIEHRLINLLEAATERANCQIEAGGARLKLSESTVYLPDVAIVCDAGDVNDDYFERPCVLFEILSPSTESIDRREKRAAYQQLDSLLAYLIIHQDQQVVERFWRDEPGAPWHALVYTGGAVPIPCVDLELPIAAIYDGVQADNSGVTDLTR